MPQKNVLIAISILNGALYGITSIIILAFDIATMSETLYNGSIAMEVFDTYVSYTAIFYIVIILGCIFILITIASFILSFYEYDIWREMIVASFLINLIREALYFKFTQCLNYSSYPIIQARTSMTFFSLFFVIIFMLKSNTYESLLEKNKKLTIINLVVLSIMIVTILGLNIKILADLNNSTIKEIGKPENIHIGFFTKDEIDLVRNNSYLKDTNYDYRIVIDLYDIVYNDIEPLGYLDCKGKNCGGLFKSLFKREIKLINKEIMCDSINKEFYSDCENAQKLVIQFRYVKNYGLPTYECNRIDKNNMSQTNCIGLKDYKLYLVQEFGNKVELTWNGFCKCESYKPQVELSLTKIKQNL